MKQKEWFLNQHHFPLSDRSCSSDGKGGSLDASCALDGGFTNGFAVIAGVVLFLF